MDLRVHMGNYIKFKAMGVQLNQETKHVFETSGPTFSRFFPEDHDMDFTREQLVFTATSLYMVRIGSPKQTKHLTSGVWPS